ncbi:hypothetical protein D9M73_183700 [compost metagenome]
MAWGNTCWVRCSWRASGASLHSRLRCSGRSLPRRCLACTRLMRKTNVAGPLGSCKRQPRLAESSRISRVAAGKRPGGGSCASGLKLTWSCGLRLPSSTVKARTASLSSRAVNSTSAACTEEARNSTAVHSHARHRLILELQLCAKRQHMAAVKAVIDPGQGLVVETVLVQGRQFQAGIVQGNALGQAQVRALEAVLVQGIVVVVQQRT